MAACCFGGRQGLALPPLCLPSVLRPPFCSMAHTMAHIAPSPNFFKEKSGSFLLSPSSWSRSIAFPNPQVLLGTVVCLPHFWGTSCMPFGRPQRGKPWLDVRRSRSLFSLWPHPRLFFEKQPTCVVPFARGQQATRHAPAHRPCHRVFPAQANPPFLASITPVPIPPPPPPLLSSPPQHRPFPP